MSDAELVMERPLAMRLLHEAQVAETEVRGVVTASVTADGYYAGDWGAASSRAAADGRRPWAVFAYRPGHFQAPAVSEFGAHPGLLRITACLETKGVLQLRVYRAAEGRIEECPLRIVD